MKKVKKKINRKFVIFYSREISLYIAWECLRNASLRHKNNFFSRSFFTVGTKLDFLANKYQRTNGPVNAHLISWPSKAQNIQNLENIW